LNKLFPALLLVLTARTITEGIYDPESLALDSAANLYVGNGGYADSVTVYAPSGALLRTIRKGSRIPNPSRSMLVTTFVANTNLGAGRTVTVYSPGKSKLVQTITDGIDSPNRYLPVRRGSFM
jgi:sugar lactone lactonase YvrE